MPKAPQNLRDFQSLLKVVESLRGPDGCPWDKEQTHESLTRFAIEEAFELSEAIDSGVSKDICDELGDVLLQVVLHSEIARQDGQFDILDVIQNLNEKMVRRHPHVFGDEKAKDSAAVVKSWSAIKASEKGESENRPLTFDIPEGLPALLRAHKVGEKTRKFDFDWTDAAHCWPKINEEIAELEEAIHDGNKKEIQAELGDVLFSIVQLARHLKIDAEQALRQTNSRFETRFQRMQKAVLKDGLEWSELTPEQKETYWKKAKPAQL